MTKTQKIWLMILGAMFILPEVLWGGLITTFFKFKIIPLFDTGSFFVNYPLLGHIMFLLEIAGVFGLLFINQKSQYNKSLKYFLSVILFLILISIIWIAYVYYSFYRVSFP
ncbi:MAG: hypothetical protein WCT19_00240 [Candidatus Paceibacterota bacterium]|jgi:hypothetical protein